MPVIPTRDPVGDRFSGVLLRYATAILLAETPLPETEIVHSGDFVLRYGVRYVDKPHLSMVPGLIVVDYGEMLTGEAMWDFITTRSNLYPRADVVGYRNDGEDDMIVLKKLDLAQPLQILAYEFSDHVQPLASVNALITSDVGTVSPRILEHLPHYTTLDDWKTR